MTWKDAGQYIAKTLPLIGSVIGGSAGEKVGELAARALGVPAEPDKVVEALKNNPDAFLKLKEIEANHEIELQRIELGSIQAVNETMRAETASTNGFSAFWRPFWGVISGCAFGVVVVFACILAYQAVISKSAEAMTMLPQFITSMTALFAIPGAILGISAWHRGMMQRAEAGDGNG